MLSKIWNVLLIVFVFLLPWQTRYIYEPRYLNGGFWEFGSSSLFGFEILLWIIVILFAADTFRKRRIAHLFSKVHFQTHRKNLYIALSFIVFLIAGVLHSQNPAVSYDYVFHVLEGVCLFIIISSLENKDKLFYTMWFSGIFQAAFGVYQFFTQQVAASKWLGLALHKPEQLGAFVIEFGDERWLRAYGSFGSPNILGGFLAVSFTAGLLIYFTSKPAVRILLTLGQAVILTGLVLTFSRGSWVAAAAGFISCGAYIIYIGGDRSLSFFKRFKYIGQYTKQAVFYGIILAGLFSLLSPLFMVRFNPAYRLEAKSLSERRVQYQESFKMINKNLLFGVGPGAYTYSLYKTEPKKQVYEYQPVHNIYLLIFSEWGILGLAVWFLIFGYFLKIILLNRPEFLPLIVTVLVSGAFDHFWWSLPGSMLFWWLIYSLAIFPRSIDEKANL